MAESHPDPTENSADMYPDTAVECRRCDTRDMRAVHRAYSPGDLALLECPRCGSETEHMIVRGDLY